MRDIISDLVKLSAEMARKNNMPSPFVEDWDFPSTVSRKQRLKVLDAADKATAQCNDWATRLRMITDKIIQCNKRNR